MFGARISPLGRQAALALAAGRVGIGASALLATRPALRALGFGDAAALAGLWAWRRLRG